MTRVGRFAAAVAVAAAIGSMLQGCGGGAQELLDTAQLEETQRNVPHARELYQEIVRRYPGTPEAAKAAERLKALEQAPAPPGNQPR